MSGKRQPPPLSSSNLTTDLAGSIRSGSFIIERERPAFLSSCTTSRRSCCAASEVAR
jgi:hypothetical protein